MSYDAISSPQQQATAALFRRMAREEAKIDRLIQQEESQVEKKLKLRYQNLNRIPDREAERAKILSHNTELRERLVFEVDASVQEDQQTRAARQYSSAQLELQFPDWFKTVKCCVALVRDKGHNNKSKWRSHVSTLLRRCILETEDDPHGTESRMRLRRIALEINNVTANELVRILEDLKGQYVQDSVNEGSKIGVDSIMYQESSAAMKTIDTQIVPLSHDDWSEALQVLDMTLKSAGMRDSTATLSTISRPQFLSESIISEMFDGQGSAILPPSIVSSISPIVIDLSGEDNNNSEITAISNPQNPTSTIKGTYSTQPNRGKKNPLNGIPTMARKGATHGGNVHPFCHNENQAQAIMRMRTAAMLGNFELCRSIFMHNFDSPELLGKGRYTVGWDPPTLDVFRSLMVAFKNNPTTKFEDAFAVMDMIEMYGMAPDAPIYNVMMRACEKESRWRRSLAMYRDMLEIHKVVPNVHTFDIIIDCCRHSLESPSVIFETLRQHKLPREYCYKAALCNCGNRIPTQFLYEAMYDISAEKLRRHKFEEKSADTDDSEEQREKIRKYQWAKLSNKLKSTLPSISPVRKAVPSDPLRAWNTQLSNSVPYEQSELSIRRHIGMEQMGSIAHPKFFLGMDSGSVASFGAQVKTSKINRNEQNPHPKNLNDVFDESRGKKKTARLLQEEALAGLPVEKSQPAHPTRTFDRRYRHVTSQPPQKAIAKLPRSPELERALKESILLGESVSVIWRSSDHHTTVLLKGI